MGRVSITDGQHTNGCAVVLVGCAAVIVGLAVAFIIAVVLVGIVT